jgi:hypothetical protein
MTETPLQKYVLDLMRRSSDLTEEIPFDALDEPVQTAVRRVLNSQAQIKMAVMRLLDEIDPPVQPETD